jgi:hypothetical protein
MNADLAPRVQEYLRRAGWFPGRVDTETDWVELYRRHGIELPDHVLAFYREFGNLVITKPAGYRLGLHPRWRIPWLLVASWRPWFSFVATPPDIPLREALKPLLGPTFDIGGWVKPDYVDARGQSHYGGIEPYIMDSQGRFYWIDVISGNVFWHADEMNGLLGGKRFGPLPRLVGCIAIPD